MPVACNRSAQPAQRGPLRRVSTAALQAGPWVRRWHCLVSSWEFLRGCPAGSVIPGSRLSQGPGSCW